MLRWSLPLALSVTVAALGGVGPVAAQVRDTSAVPTVAVPVSGLTPAPRPSTAIRWWQGALVMGGVSALTWLDEPTRRFVQDHRSPTSNNAADIVRPFGEAKVYLGLTAGLLAVGVVSHQSKLLNAGSRLASTLVLASGVAEGVKFAAGRHRPDDSLFDSDDFAPFSGRTSMPSGHSTLAFAFATELADDIHTPWATAGLYTLATAVGWSRLNDNRHWLSDVGAGAALGIVSAKIVDGRWRVFNLRPPRVTFDSRHLNVGWQGSF
jgi:membrane-associated phospholipid phosphatase